MISGKTINVDMDYKSSKTAYQKEKIKFWCGFML